MRELTVRLRFTSPCLGNCKERDGSGRFVFLRSPSGHVTFLAPWHHANMRLAAQLLGKHQDEVGKIFWDINIDARVRHDRWYKLYYQSKEGNRQRFSQHEAFFPGQIISINCVVPTPINDEDFWRLMSKAGQYKGLSPWKPGEYGFFEVVSIRPRRAPQAEEETIRELLAEPTQSHEEIKMAQDLKQPT